MLKYIKLNTILKSSIEYECETPSPGRQTGHLEDILILVYLCPCIPVYLEPKGVIPQRLFMPNKPNFKIRKIAVSDSILRTKGYRRRTASQKNKPKQTQFDIL